MSNKIKATIVVKHPDGDVHHKVEIPKHPYQEDESDKTVVQRYGKYNSYERLRNLLPKDAKLPKGHSLDLIPGHNIKESAIERFKDIILEALLND